MSDISSLINITSSAVNNLVDGSSTRIRKSLAQLYDEFEQEDFVFVDRGTIVNLAHIMTISDGTVKLTSGDCLYTSQTKIEDVKNRLNIFWRKHI